MKKLLVTLLVVIGTGLIAYRVYDVLVVPLEPTEEPNRLDSFAVAQEKPLQPGGWGGAMGPVLDSTDTRFFFELPSGTFARIAEMAGFLGEPLADIERVMFKDHMFVDMNSDQHMLLAIIQPVQGQLPSRIKVFVDQKGSKKLYHYTLTHKDLLKFESASDTVHRQVVLNALQSFLKDS